MQDIETGLMKGRNEAPGSPTPGSPLVTPRDMMRRGSSRSASVTPQVPNYPLSDDLFATLSQQLSSLQPPARPAPSVPTEVRGITVFENDKSQDNIIGEVIINTASTSVSDLMTMIVEELGKGEGFAIKKNNIPISKAQYARKAAEFFRTDDDCCVIVQ